jgi:preprotein translocase subunit SecG
MTTLHIFLLIVFAFLCLLLIAAILLQSGKGGGMAGLGGGASDSTFGAHTANVLQKFTMICVGIFFVLVVVLAHTLKGSNGDVSSVLDNYKPEKPTAVPVNNAPPATGAGSANPVAPKTVPVIPESLPKPAGE